MNEKTAGVVILYNPEDNVIENISSYADQVDFLFIIDNSEKRKNFTNNYLKEIKNVEYVYNNINLGVAASLNIASKKAMGKGCSYLLTMDQDSKAPDNLVGSLLNCVAEVKRPGIISPLHSNIYGTQKNASGSKFSKVESVMTSGNLISLEAYKTVGGFDEDYFIDYVDIEYCLRLKLNDYGVYCINNVLLQHREGNISEKTFLFRKVYPTNNTPTRWYYKTRNLLYLSFKYRKIFPVLIKKEILIYFKNILKIVLFEKQKLTKIKMIINGVRDCLRDVKGQKY